MLKFSIEIIIFLIVGMAGGIFATQIIWPNFVEEPILKAIQNAPIAQHDQTVAKQNNDLTQAVKEAEKTILGVGSVVANKKYLSGSGLVITNDGLVLSLANIISQNPSVFYNEETISAKTLKKDSLSNLSLLKIEKNNLPACRFAPPEKIKLGEKVFIMGKKFDGKDFVTFVDDGIIKNFNNNLIETNISEDKFAAGTALFNIDGEVLGINYLSSSGRVVAIPAQIIRQFINF